MIKEYVKNIKPRETSQKRSNTDAKTHRRKFK